MFKFVWKWSGRVLRVAAGVVIGLTLVLVAVVWLRQSALIYDPSPRLIAVPSQLKLPYEDLSLPSGGGGIRLNAWFIPVSNALATVMVCNNSAANQSYNMGMLEFLRDMHLNVMSFDYRGFGKSSGSPTEAGTYADARTVWAYLTQTRGIPTNRIVLYGQGVGAAVAVQLASRVNPAGLVVASGFDSLECVLVGQHTNVPAIVVRILCRYEYDNTKTIRDVSCPKLFYHSAEDARVPIERGRKLFELAQEPKRFVETHGYYGDEIYASRSELRKAWVALIADVVNNTAPSARPEESKPTQ